MNDGSWLIVINYQEDGYVKDDDAQDINANQNRCYAFAEQQFRLWHFAQRAVKQ